MMNLSVVKLQLSDLTADNDAGLRAAVQRLSGVKQVDTNIGKRVMRVIATRPITKNEVRDALTGASLSAACNIQRLHISGMSCQACEIKIEKAWQALPGVKKVSVDALSGNAKIVFDGAAPPLDALNTAIAVHGYRAEPRHASSPVPFVASDRPSFWQLLALFGVVLLLGSLLSRFGWLRPNVGFGASTSFLAVFLIGLLAASSSCIAVTGGLMLGTIAHERTKMKSVLLFVAGRIASYAIFGGIIGLIGKALTPSPTFVGAVTLVAALYMLVMGLDMLHLSPAWLRRLTPRIMPKAIGHRVLAQEGTRHAFAPALLGAGTFFLPCGFTQALQLYALTTGSAFASASLLLAFALGTAPALVALGWASNSLKGKAGRLFFRFSGALVVVLGLWNIQNGMTITGHPLRLPRFSGAETATAASGAVVNDPNVQFDGNTQSVNINVDYGGYAPNRFTLRSGASTRFNVSGPAAGQGCLGVFQIPALGVRSLLKPGAVTPIAFTSPKPGRYAFSCSMGMFRGEFTVI